ncbi:alpha/beta hydrolase [Sphingobium chlorophenolicum]|uniref:Uncharacterized protein n=1 Tax=Sphingobium chlorophenolicum TaxID=46429 RepID=A0A081RF22_SPHCR|nr:alpha/beta hydrolase [Sphingobium chlorophenolicum]KEQ53795.1 hypothetical protein BV95_01840 [Sphingobium chlorophenolicum]
MIVKSNIVYANSPRPLLWDIYRPDEASGPLPAVLVFYGGGYMHGSPEDMAAACAALVDQGFVAIAPEYRLFGEAAWPAALRDAEQAIAAAVANAGSLGIDPNLVFCLGYSAGAHLSLLAAASTGLAAGLASFFPRVRIGSAEAGRFGLSDPAQWTAASPIAFADKLPPTIIFTGDDDEVVPFEDSVDLYRAMRAAGRVADLQIFSPLPHEFVTLPGMREQTIASAAAFFRRSVIDREEFSSAVADLRAWWATIIPTLAASNAPAGATS